jgi:tetratricopeptide (TPR) repeat protein
MKRKEAIVALALAAVTVVAYLPVFQNGFVNYDDDYYITQNPYLRLGLAPEGLKWAFTESYGANWYPLTQLSLMADYALFGPSPAAFHGTNLALHLAGVVVLFTVFWQMTASLPASAFVAAVFALHPTHVESVAWAAERKDVLSGLFFALTLWAYRRYVRKAEGVRFLLVAFFLGLGLMSKPMVVTLPFVLVLLDFWPLDRFEKVGARRLVLEKAPLFALVLGMSVVTFFAQRAEGAVQALGTYSLAVRVENALVAYVAYIGKAFWPVGLSPYYPHPGDGIPLWKAAAAFAFLAAATGVAVVLGRMDRSLRFVPVGWLWYVGTLVPVIGIVQVGQQAMADRYTYLPYIGLSIVVAFGALAVSKRVVALVAVGTVMALAMAALTNAQVRIWRDSVTLFEHATAVTEDNALAHINLGVAYLNDGRFDDASRELERAIEIHPGSAEAYFSLASVRARQRRPEEALELYRAALRLDPSSSATHGELGRFLLGRGDPGQALVHFREATALSPEDGDLLADQALALASQGRQEEADRLFREAAGRASDPARLNYNRGVVLLGRGDPEQAARHFEEALAIRPDYYDAEYHLGLALATAGNLDEAFEHLEKARELNPESAEVYYSLGLVFARLGDLDRAASSFSRSIELDPDQPDAHYSLGLAYAGRGNLDHAIESYQRALESNPDYAQAHNSWGYALAAMGRLDEAIEHFERALRLDPNLAAAHNNWALALSQSGRIAEAVEHFRAAVELDPGNPDAHNNLGVSLGQLGRFEEAVKAFETAVELYPGHESARRNLENAREALRE